MTEKSKRMIRDLMKIVISEIEQNPAFAKQIETALCVESKSESKRIVEASRARNRRAPAVLDPILLARKGKEALWEELKPLSIEQLKDIIAEYGMDTDRQTRRWNTPDRLIERIVEISLARAHRGAAFMRPR